MYKANDLIRFRLFALDSDTRPISINENIVVSVVDPKGFSINTINNVTLVKGMYKNDFQVSSILTTGLRTIRVDIGDRVRKFFNVFAQNLTQQTILDF